MDREIEDGPTIALTAMSHEVDDAMLLACNQTAEALDSGRTGAFERDGGLHIVDNIFEALPFVIDVERDKFLTERVGGDSYNVQGLHELWGFDALLCWEAAYKWSFQHEEVIGAVEVFPGNGI